MSAFAFGDIRWPGIAKLNEECGELVQVVGKLLMTHGDPPPSHAACERSSPDRGRGVGMADTLACPQCAHRSTGVTDSRGIEDGSHVRRRRECKGCGHRFTTYEAISGEEPTVIDVSALPKLLQHNLRALVAAMAAPAPSQEQGE